MNKFDFRSMYFYLLFLVSMAAAIQPPMLFGRPRGGFMMEPDDGPITDPKYIIQSNVTQLTDHFNSSNTGTWQQRYQYNNKFYNASTGLVFVMLGGESQIALKWVNNEGVQMVNWAKEFGAAVFQVEHRFYGPRDYTPYNSQTVDALQYLTIDQALEDIKNWMTQMNALYFPNDNPKWIMFGGSYPGSLTAFFRETYPSMTIGAVSSSSAVNVFVDYYGYIQNMERNYRNVSADCATAIQVGFSKMQNLAYQGPTGRAALKKQFNLCQDFDESIVVKSVQNFFSNVVGMFEGINQYTGDNRDNATRSGLGIPGACNIMTNASIGSEMDRIFAVWNFYNMWRAPDQLACNDNNYTDFIAFMSDTSYTDDDVVGSRSWVWQTCTELGYYQTTDYGSSIFGSTIPLDFYADQCLSIFDKTYTLDRTFKLISQVSAKYGGGTNYRGSKCAFPNGSFDPWRDLGMLTPNPANDVDAFLIDGTAHCADMYPSSPNDRQSLIDARKRIHDHLATWIAEAQNQQTTTQSPQTTSQSPQTTTQSPQTMTQSPQTTSTAPITTSGGYSISSSFVTLIASFIMSRLL